MTTHAKGCALITQVVCRRRLLRFAASIVYSAGKFRGADFLSIQANGTAEVLQVGAVKVPGQGLPRPDVRDNGFAFPRILHTRLGAGLVVSEMIACDTALLGSEELRLRAEGAGLGIHVVQIAGRDPEAIRDGVRVAEAAGAHIVDINMGCPAKRVDERIRRLGADARARIWRSADRGDGRRRLRAGHAEDAARLGQKASMRRPRAAGGSGGRSARHRAWPDALPVL